MMPQAPHGRHDGNYRGARRRSGQADQLNCRPLRV